MTKSIGVAILLACAAGQLGAAGRVAACATSGSDFCALERAEDLVFLPDSDWFVVSTSSAGAPLLFIDARSRRRVPLAGPFAAPTRATAGDPDCAGPPAQLRAGGNDVRRLRGQLQLVVLNKAQPRSASSASSSSFVPLDRVEFFAVTMLRSAPRAQWIGCVAVPSRYALNDIALATDGTLYGSHQFDRPGSPAEAAATRQKWLDGAPTGAGVVWQHGSSWRVVTGTEVSFANGIAVSRDDQQLAVAGTYSGALMLVERRSGIVRRVVLPHTPDNLTALAAGGFLSVGHTGVPVTGVDPCRPPDAVPCGFPFSVARIQPDPDGGPPRVTVLFEDDGKRIPGASVAVPHAGDLYLGSAFGDRVTVVRRAFAQPLQ